MSDNVLFRGMVDGRSEITEPRFSHTVEVLKRFIRILQNDNELVTQVPSIGDGLCVVRKKNE